MTASSVTGKGQGSADKPSIIDLSNFANNGPTILFTGFVDLTADEVSSPPTPIAIVTFPYTLPGPVDLYVVLLTTINGGAAYVVDRIVDGGTGNYTGFGAIAEAECTAMYMVARAGTRLQD